MPRTGPSSSTSSTSYFPPAPGPPACETQRDDAAKTKNVDDRTASNGGVGWGVSKLGPSPDCPAAFLPALPTERAGRAPPCSWERVAVGRSRASVLLRGARPGRRLRGRTPPLARATRSACSRKGRGGSSRHVYEGGGETEGGGGGEEGAQGMRMRKGKGGGGKQPGGPTNSLSSRRPCGAAGAP